VCKMSREEILNTLREFKHEYAEKLGIIALGFFGSAARENILEKPGDVDVIIRLRKADLFLIAGIKNELEERLHMPVDIITYRDSMNQFLKSRIDREALYA